MIDSSKCGQQIVGDFDEIHIVSNKQMLIERICSLKSGEGFNWNDIDEDGSVGTAYRAEKLTWNDSVIVLIGGYGSIVTASYLDDETFDGSCSSCDRDFIEIAVSEHFANRFIKNGDMILMAAD